MPSGKRKITIRKSIDMWHIRTDSIYTSWNKIWRISTWHRFWASRRNGIDSERGIELLFSLLKQIKEFIEAIKTYHPFKKNLFRDLRLDQIEFRQLCLIVIRVLTLTLVLFWLGLAEVWDWFWLGYWLVWSIGWVGT